MVWRHGTKCLEQDFDRLSSIADRQLSFKVGCLTDGIHISVFLFTLRSYSWLLVGSCASFGSSGSSGSKGSA